MLAHHDRRGHHGRGGAGRTGDRTGAGGLPRSGHARSASATSFERASWASCGMSASDSRTAARRDGLVAAGLAHDGACHVPAAARQLRLQDRQRSGDRQLGQQADALLGPASAHAPTIRARNWRRISPSTCVRVRPWLRSDRQDSRQYRARQRRFGTITPLATPRDPNPVRTACGSPVRGERVQVLAVDRDVPLGGVLERHRLQQRRERAVHQPVEQHQRLVWGNRRHDGEFRVDGAGGAAVSTPNVRPNLILRNTQFARIDRGSGGARRSGSAGRLWPRWMR